MQNEGGGVVRVWEGRDQYCVKVFIIYQPDVQFLIISTLLIILLYKYSDGEIST